jgi:hypothetical protein
MWPGHGVRYGRSRNSSHIGPEASLQGKFFYLPADPIMDPSSVTCTMFFLLKKQAFSSLVSNYHILLSNRKANITRNVPAYRLELKKFSGLKEPESHASYSMPCNIVNLKKLFKLAK